MTTETIVGVGIVGTGRVAQALGRLLRERGSTVVAVAGRDPVRTAEAARFIGACGVAALEEIGRLAGRLVIAVSDDAVAEVAAKLAPCARKGGVALHTCGVRGSEALKTLSAVGVHCGALHPLATVPSATEGLRTLIGAAYGFTGDEAVRGWAGEMVEALEGEMYDVPESGRALYHAAASLACNSIPSLLDAAARMLAGSGAVSGADALRLLEPLVRSSLENTFRLGPEAALTGPARRGDASTLLLHLEALASQDPAIGDLYRAHGLWQLALARQAGLDAEKAERVEEVLRHE